MCARCHYIKETSLSALRPSFYPLLLLERSSACPAALSHRRGLWPAAMASGASYLTGLNLLKRARRGLYAGRMVLSGNKISEDGGNR